MSSPYLKIVVRLLKPRPCHRLGPWPLARRPDVGAVRGLLHFGGRWALGDLGGCFGLLRGHGGAGFQLTSCGRESPLRKGQLAREPLHRAQSRCGHHGGGRFGASSRYFSPSKRNEWMGCRQARWVFCRLISGNWPCGSTKFRSRYHLGGLRAPRGSFFLVCSTPWRNPTFYFRALNIFLPNRALIV